MTGTQGSITHLFDEVRTVCVGRFLLDVPINASVVYGRVDAPFEIIRFRGDARNIDNIINGYREKIEQRRRRIHGDLAKKESMLSKVVRGAGTNHQIFFDLSVLSSDRYSIKSFVTFGEDLYLIFGNDYADAANYPQAVAELNSAVSRLRPRAEHEIPTEAGFCTDGAFVTSTQNPEVERIQFGVRLMDFPDIHLSIEMTRKDVRIESDALEPRLIEAEREANESGNGAWYRRIKQLHRGSRTLTPWQGYQILARLPRQENAGETHEFNFVALGEPNNEYIPTIDIEMNTGLFQNIRGAVKPSVTDEEAIYVWERFIGSLRVRPIATKKNQR